MADNKKQQVKQASEKEQGMEQQENQFIIIPTGVFKAATTFTSKDKVRPVLQSVRIEGKLKDVNNGKVLDVTVVATDSFKLVTLKTRLSKDFFNATEDFEWCVRPTDKLNGASDVLRIEQSGYKQFEVTTYKGGKGAVGYALAVNKVKPTSYHMWESFVDGTYPNYKSLMKEKLYAACNFQFNSAFMTDVCKAAQLAISSKDNPLTFLGSGDKGTALRFAASGSDGHGFDVQMEALLMPIRTKGVVIGANAPTDEETVPKKQYDELLDLKRKEDEELHKAWKEIDDLKASKPVKSAKDKPCDVCASNDGKLREEINKLKADYNVLLKTGQAQLDAKCAEIKQLNDTIGKYQGKYADALVERKAALDKVAKLESELDAKASEKEEKGMAEVVQFNAPVNKTDLAIGVNDDGSGVQLDNESGNLTGRIFIGWSVQGEKYWPITFNGKHIEKAKCLFIYGAQCNEKDEVQKSLRGIEGFEDAEIEWAPNKKCFFFNNPFCTAEQVA